MRPLRGRGALLRVPLLPPRGAASRPPPPATFRRESGAVSCAWSRKIESFGPLRLAAGVSTMHAGLSFPGQSHDSSQRTASRPLPAWILVVLLLLLALGVAFSLVNMYAAEFFRTGSFVAAARSAFQSRTGGPNNRWIGPPASLMHGMADEELFRQASSIPRVETTRPPKIAFMFLTRGRLPLHPLWEVFLRGSEELYAIYIHSMPSYQPEFNRSSPFYGRQIPSKQAEWGGISILDAERRLLANALLDVSNEWFVLLSESCIPLFPFGAVYEHFQGSEHSFVDVFDDPGPSAMGRYSPELAPEIEVSQWRKGSQWFQLRRGLAVAVMKDGRFYPKFRQYCETNPMCYVDEHYLPTMLFVEAPDLLANRSVTWTDWSNSGSHPATYGVSDVAEPLLRQITGGQRCRYDGRNSTVCFLFARKFDPEALQPLLDLAPTVLGYG